mgnify:FL=1
MSAEWIQLSSEPFEENGSRQLRTYAVHIKVDTPYPCPKHATPRMIDGEFVWERLIQAKGRAGAVEEAGEWFRSVKQRDYAKGLKNKNAHECVTVDDKGKESKFGSDFKPSKSVNRLLDEETIARLLEESKGLLKVCDKPFKLGEKVHYPSLDWADENKKVNKDPIKTGILAISDPKEGMKEELEKALEREKARKKKGTSWFRMNHLAESRKLIRTMRKKGQIEHTSKILKRIASSKKAKEAREKLKEVKK